MGGLIVPPQVVQDFVDMFAEDPETIKDPSFPFRVRMGYITALDATLRTATVRFNNEVGNENAGFKWPVGYMPWVGAKVVVAFNGPDAFILGEMNTYEDAGWKDLQPLLVNSWVAENTAGYLVPQYRKQLDRVYLRGAIQSGTFDVAAFTMPTGYRPVGNAWWLVVGGGGTATRCSIQSGGVFVVSSGGGTNSNINLDPCSYSILASA